MRIENKQYNTLFLLILYVYIIILTLIRIHIHTRFFFNLYYSLSRSNLSYKIILIYQVYYFIVFYGFESFDSIAT